MSRSHEPSRTYAILQLLESCLTPADFIIFPPAAVCLEALVCVAAGNVTAIYQRDSLTHNVDRIKLNNKKWNKF